MHALHAANPDRFLMKCSSFLKPTRSDPWAPLGAVPKLKATKQKPSSMWEGSYKSPSRWQRAWNPVTCSILQALQNIPPFSFLKWNQPFVLSPVMKNWWVLISCFSIFKCFLFDTCPCIQLIYILKVCKNEIHLNVYYQVWLQSFGSLSTVS